MNNLNIVEKVWTNENPVKIIFGNKARESLISFISNKKVLIVTSNRGRLYIEKELPTITDCNKVTWIDNISPNPTLIDLQLNINLLKNSIFDLIIAFGGGSVIDSAKVLSVSINNTHYLLKDLIENPKKISFAIPVYAVPTTAGTGSEVTPFATIWDDKEKIKLSLSSSFLYPICAIIDPELYVTMPDDVLFSTGLDTINQAIESIWNKSSTPITLNYAFDSLKLGMPALSNLKENRTSDNYTNLGYSSLLSGLAISQTRTSICHSISYPITAHYNVPHGYACAFTMPEVLKICIDKDKTLFTRLSKHMINQNANASDLINYFITFNKIFDVRNKVKSYVHNIENLFLISNKMITKERMDNGIITLNHEQIKNLLLNSWNY